MFRIGYQKRAGKGWEGVGNGVRIMFSSVWFLCTFSSFFSSLESVVQKRGDIGGSGAPALAIRQEARHAIEVRHSSSQGTHIIRLPPRQ